MDLVDIPESFVNFTTDGSTTETDFSCVDSVGGCYPISDLNDVKFQVLMTLGIDDANYDRIIGGLATFHISVAHSCDECDSASTKAAQLHVEPWKSSGTDMYDYIVLSVDEWTHPEVLDPFNDGECLVMCLWLKGGEGQVVEYVKVGCSQCFIKVVDTCDTSIVEYRQNETSMGFYNNGGMYYDDYFNSIRLPLRLHRPQPKSKKNVYRLSNGNYIKNSATMAMEWLCETDMMSEKWHRKLSIAIEHDQLKITNENAGFNQAFFMSEAEDNYKIDWQEFLDFPHAKAEFKLMQMPFNEFNNNCNLTPLNPDTNINALLANTYNILAWG